MDATADSSQLDEEVRIIADAPDLSIRVVGPQALGDEAKPRQAVLFKVSRAAMGRVRYFKAMLRGNFKESRQSTITLEGDDPLAMHIWFDLLHHDTSRVDHEGITVVTVWEMLVSADKYSIHPQTAVAKKWFVEWLGPVKSLVERFDLKGKQDWEILQHFRELLFPCFSFDHAEAFATLTRRLVYQSPYHITETRPEAITQARLDGVDPNHLHLRSNIIQQFNAAKGRLRTILHTGLWTPIKKIVDGVGFDNQERTLWNYIVGLMDTEAFPIEEFAHKHGMDELCRRLDTYSSGPFDQNIEKAVDETRGYFHGLCLDCMNHSKLSDGDTDYWHHANPGVPWDRGCRIKHGEPTWYFSFMGRREKMAEWTRERRREAREEERRERFMDRI